MGKVRWCVVSGVKKCIIFVRGMLRKLLFRLRLSEKDWWWHFTGADSWGLFPPSFHHSHTEEEAARIKEETLKLLKEIINDDEA